jgi:TM2 domain-containing membrane protein YozV
MSLNGITPEEMGFLQQATTTLDENQHRQFFMIYSGKRKSPQDILIFALVGMFLVPGLQRFIIGEIGMGIVYLLTIGLCFVGSVMDLINYKSLAMEFNKKMAYESFQIVKMNG